MKKFVVIDLGFWQEKVLDSQVKAEYLFKTKFYPLLNSFLADFIINLGAYVNPHLDNPDFVTFICYLYLLNNPVDICEDPCVDTKVVWASTSNTPADNSHNFNVTIFGHSD